jgi:serine/threonine-protein kinase
MNEVFARLTPALHDRYRVERELGSGGMATVFRAHDVRHDRAVAIKVLHPEIGAMLGAQRFLAEITTTAKLQHPHILPLLDSGDADGLLYYVMPVVDGESLRARLERETQLPIDDAIRITREAASALDYSHRHGVIHRDIKPENILLHEGHALVADFGIALALSAAGGTRLTATGLSLGTPQYMSPEQATGEKTIDARTDVYSLGCVLYEMLTGEPPFTGATAQAVIAQVITATPDPASATRPTVPAHVDAAVARALQKIPADRFSSASEFTQALESTGPATSALAGRAPRRRLPISYAWPAVAIACLMLGAAGEALLRRSGGQSAGDAPTMRLSSPVPRLKNHNGAVAVASRGQFAVVIGGDDSRIYVRKLDQFDVVPVAGTQGAQNVFLSPDDQWIGFTSNDRLRKVHIEGGPIADIAEATWGGGAWGPDGTIVYSPSPTSGLWRTTADGGKPERITAPDSVHGEFSHWWPQFLPDGHTILFTTYRTPFSTSRIEAIDLTTKHRTVLVEGAIGGVYVRSGHILFSRGTATIFAVSFDADHLQVRGDPKAVLDDVDGNPAQGRVFLAVSGNGTLVTLPQSQWSPKRALEWIDRNGKESLAVPTPGFYSSPRIAPDGRMLAFTRLDEGRDVWLYDPARGLMTVVTHNDAADFNPVWTPDGRRLVYMSEHGAFQLYSRSADLSTPERPLLISKVDKFPTSVSPDGKLLAFTEWATDRNVKFVALDGTSPTPTFPNSESNDEQAAFSPDGHWIAYESDESGIAEVYARPFPNMFGRPIRISIAGGTEPHWTRGGREIVFRRGDSVVAASFDPVKGTPGAPATLFAIPTAYEGFRATYDAAADGLRFLVSKPLYPSAASNINFVVNWFPELRQAMSK